MISNHVFQQRHHRQQKPDSSFIIYINGVNVELNAPFVKWTWSSKNCVLNYIVVQRSIYSHSHVSEGFDTLIIHRQNFSPTRKHQNRTCILRIIVSVLHLFTILTNVAIKEYLMNNNKQQYETSNISQIMLLLNLTCYLKCDPYGRILINITTIWHSISCRCNSTCSTLRFMLQEVLVFGVQQFPQRQLL